MSLISVVVPCYNEESVLELFYGQLNSISVQLHEQYGTELEVIFINDGSRDNTLDRMRELAGKDRRIKYISFSRNFGKEAGLYAGLKHATGDYIAVMDADMQDPPEFLVRMYEELQGGKVDCVAARRVTRDGEPRIRTFFAGIFYKCINKMSRTRIVDGARDFRMMTRQMVDAILQMGEYNRFSKGLFSWVGFETKWISYANVERIAGDTSWSFWGLIKYAMDGMIAFSTAPLVMVTMLGLLFSLIAFAMILFFFVKTLVWGDPVDGYPSLVCFLFLIGGVQTMCIGIVGQYLAKIYTEVKQRPIYIIKETNIDEEREDEQKNLE